MKRLLNKILSLFIKSKKQSVKILFKDIKKSLKDLSKNQLIRVIIELQLHITKLKKIIEKR